jgi:hypothetical protein
MATSSIPRVKARLVELLDAADWPDDRPKVSYGWTRDPVRELVVVGGTIERGDQTFVALAGRKRDEDYGLRVLINVTNPGMDQQAATERAFDLLGVVEDVVRADPKLGLDEVIAAQINQVELNEAPDVEGFVAQVIAAVRVRARI